MHIDEYTADVHLRPVLGIITAEIQFVIQDLDIVVPNVSNCVKLYLQLSINCESLGPKNIKNFHCNVLENAPMCLHPA